MAFSHSGKLFAIATTRAVDLFDGANGHGLAHAALREEVEGLELAFTATERYLALARASGEGTRTTWFVSIDGVPRGHAFAPATRPRYFYDHGW